jgi:hypothetical protein
MLCESCQTAACSWCPPRQLTAAMNQVTASLLPLPVVTLHSTCRFRSKKFNLLNVTTYAEGKGSQSKFSASKITPNVSGSVTGRAKDVSKTHPSFNEELCDIYKWLSIIRVVKSGWIRLDGNFVKLGQTRSEYQFWWSNLLEKFTLGRIKWGWDNNI